jgi:uncharacterized protein
VSPVGRGAMDIPYEELSETALRGIIEEFVLREGTDYGSRQYSLDQKVSAVEGQLRGGTAKIVFDEAAGTVDIVRRYGD